MIHHDNYHHLSLLIQCPRDLLTALDTYWRKGTNYVQIAIGKNSNNYDIVVKLKL